MADNLVELYKRAIEAFNGNDLETTAELVADNVVYTFHGDHPAAGRYDGHEGFREVLREPRSII